MIGLKVDKNVLWDIYNPDPAHRFKVLAVASLLELVLFGFIGLYWSVNSINAKHLEIKDLSQKEKNLQDTKFKGVESSADLKASQPYLTSLKAAVPEVGDVSNYMVDMAQLFSENGFLLKSFYPMPGAANEITITAEAVGDAASADKLLKQLESMPRLTIVKTISLIYSEDTKPNKMEVSIYYVPRPSIDFTQEFNGKIDLGFLKDNFKPAYE